MLNSRYRVVADFRIGHTARISSLLLLNHEPAIVWTWTVHRTRGLTSFYLWT
ncbi:hypothetical protein [Enterococcus sp. DIV2371]|uniref:hypothetical protein n=1 Tax=unclassified Enterococcus TaxID=2608891 RepID=UPI001AC5FFC0|nr:hypothetical protein [Enterococcus sp. DIV1271a]